MWMQVLLKLLQQLDWNYIAIVYDDDAYGRQAAEELRDLSKGQDLCVPSFYRPASRLQVCAFSVPLGLQVCAFSVPLDYRYVHFPCPSTTGMCVFPCP